MDIAKRAASALGSALEEIGSEADEQIDLEEALHGKTIFNADSGRTKARVLFVTTDTTLLEPDSENLAYFSDFSDQFDEIHILVLREGRMPRHGALRVKDNVWLYVAAAQYWWWLPVVARGVVRDELSFAGGFRPDLVIARDAYESGITAWWIAKQYEVPVQVHVLENLFHPLFVKVKKSNKWRYRLAQFILARVKSVRTPTLRLKDELTTRFSNLLDVQLWPQFHNYATIISAEPEFDVHRKFPQYTFIMTYLGNLSHQSTLPKLMDDLQEVLRNPKVGLLVIGFGSAKSEFEKKAKKMGIGKQLVFVPIVKSPIPYLKTSSIVFVTDVTSDGDNLVLDAAASGAAIIMTATDLREDVFEDNVSAMICPPGDAACIRDKFMELLYKVEKRKRMGAAATRAVLERVHEDKELFRQSVRDSIESVFSVEDVYEITDNDTGSR